MTSTFHDQANTKQRALLRIGLVGLIALLAASAPIRADEPAEGDYQPFELRSARAEDVALELQKSLQGKAQILIDRQGNRVLVRGTRQYQQIAEHLIRQLDVQPAGVKRRYSIPADSIERVANQLRYRYTNSTTVRISVDSLAGEIEVAAPEETQREVVALIGGLGGVPTAAAGPKPIRRSHEAVINRSHQLQTASADAALDKLKSIWGTALQVQVLGRGEEVRVRLQSERAPQTLVEFDRQSNVVRLEGPKTNVESWQLLLKSLDQPEDFRAGKTRLVRARQSDSEAIQKAVSLTQALSKKEGSSSDILDLISRKSRPGWGGRLVSLIFQPKEGGQDPEGGNVGDDPTGDTQVAPPTVRDDRADPAGGGLLGTVRIEFLDGLDMMIITGHPADVARVTQLIQEIQAKAEGTEPDVQIVQLRHVSSRAIYGVLIDLYQQVYAPRQGPVSITPLIKPNALLLVGRPENNQSVVSLLRQLDVPVPPETEIEVIQLQWMSAVDAAQRVNDHYNTPAPSPNPQDPSELVRGLSMRVRVTADYRSNAIIIQASPRDMSEVRRFIRKIDTENNKSLHEVKIIPLKNALAADLAPVLQDAINGQLQGAGRATTGTQQQQQQTTATPSQIRSTILEFLTINRDGTQSRVRSGILFDVRVIADQNRNALVVIGPSNSMPLLQALIDELDKLPSASAQIKVFTIVNGDATNLTIMLQQLFGQDVTAGTGSFGQAATLRAAFAPAATAGGEGSLVPVRFAVDQRTNSIVSSGSESDLAVVEAILARLDEDGIETRRTTVYRLQNAPALDVATAITDVLSRQQQASLSALTGVLSPAEQFEREVFIVPEQVSNSLIISSTPRYFDNIVQIIKDLDQRPPMVMIQVVIAEVAYGDEFQLGFEFGIQDSLVFDRGIAGGADAVTQPLVGFPFNQSNTGNDTTTGSLATRENLAGQALSNLAMGRIDAGLGYGGLVLTAGNESVNFLLRALQNNTAAQVLARPQIMTLDNQVAFVQIGARVARILGGSTTPQGGTTQNVTDVDVGVILRVQPRISPDGTVVMLLDTERSEVSETEGTTVGFAADNTPLVSQNINTTTAQTTLSARSGQTVVFAGLMQRDKAYERRSLPWFGTLPGIGWLFRFDQERERRRELLIIMTPYVIKDDEDYEWMNRMEMDRMSWCLSDVVEMHGNLGAGMAGAVFEDSGPSVIYPALDPTGTNNARPPEAESLNAPRPIQPTSSRRTSNPGPLEKVKAVVNWPRDAQKSGRHPLHVRQTAPERNPLHRSQMGSRDEPASYSPPPSQFRRPPTSDGPAQPIPSSEYPPPSGNGGAFIPSYLPTNGNTGRFDQQR